jgi:hypothetical protein
VRGAAVEAFVETALPTSSRTVSQVLQRQLTMLTLLPKFPGSIGTSELRARLQRLGFETTTRTIQRDLQALATYFAIECRSVDKPYAWSWREGAVEFGLPVLRR